MNLIRIRWPEKWTSGWYETWHFPTGGFPALPFDVRVYTGRESYIVTVIARRQDGGLICEVKG
jgi:hypothetical protein